AVTSWNVAMVSRYHPPPAFRSLDSEAVTYVHGGLCDLSHCTQPIRPALWRNSLHRARRANDHAQDHCVGLRASCCRRHSQDQARYATGATAPRSGDRDHAFATAPGRAGIALSAMNNRRFPPPWSVEEQSACFVVRDANGQQIAYVYYECEPGRQSAAKLLSKDEARRIATNIAKHARQHAGRYVHWHTHTGQWRTGGRAVENISEELKKAWRGIYLVA